jgi:hypothetical protein
MADEPTGAGTPTDGEPDEPAEEHEAPTRICLKCATQSQTGGDFCPHCGARYGKRRRSKRALALMIGIPVVLVTVAGCGSGSTHPRGGVRDEPVHALRQLIADVASANARAVCSMMAPVLQTYTYVMFIAEPTCEERVLQWIYSAAPTAERLRNVGLKLASTGRGSAVVVAATPGAAAETRLEQLNGKWLIAGSQLFLDRLNPPGPLIFRATFRHGVPLRTSDPVRIGVVDDGRVLSIRRHSGSYELTFSVDSGVLHNDASVAVGGSRRNAYLDLDIGALYSGVLAYGSQMPARGPSAN